MISASTVRGTGTAMSCAKSHSPFSITSSIVLVTTARTSPSSLATVRGVKAVCRIVRYFVCSGGSL